MQLQLHFFFLKNLKSTFPNCTSESLFHYTVYWVYCTISSEKRARNAWNRSLPGLPQSSRRSPRRGWTTSGPSTARIPFFQGNTPDGCREDATVNMFFKCKTTSKPFFIHSSKLEFLWSQEVLCFSIFSQNQSAGKLVRMDSDRSKCLSVSWKPSWCGSGILLASETGFMVFMPFEVGCILPVLHPCLERVYQHENHWEISRQETHAISHRGVNMNS
jgi:hypothetical protein